MSFRQFGGLTYSAKHNIVSSNYNTTNNFVVTQYIGKPNSYINFLSDISGNLVVYGNVDISGNINVNDNLTVNENLTINNNVTAYGNVDISGNIDISGNALVAGNLTVDDSVTVANNITAYGNVDISGNLTVDNNVIIANNITAYGNMDLSGNMDISGNISVVGELTVLGILNVQAISAPIITATTSVTAPTITATKSVTSASFNISSDYRIKDNIIPLSETEFNIDMLQPVTYTNRITNKQDIGFIAHQLQEYIPILVNGEKDGTEYQSVNYIGFIPLLIKEIQTLKKEIHDLKNRIN